MPLPPFYFPVYQFHFRLFDPGLHANPLIQTPPMLHFEGLHTLQWLTPDANALSKTVKGDGQLFALRNHDSGAFIPHLPMPLSAGPFLFETLQNSKYQVIFHQPNVELDGTAIGIFQWGLAPPWRCMEIKLPLPKFMAKLGRAGVVRKAAAAKEKATAELKKAGDALAAVGRLKSDLEDAVPEAVPKAHRAALSAAEEQVEETRASEKAGDAALKQKAEADRLARRSYLAAGKHDAEAEIHLERAKSAAPAAREAHLVAAEQHRARAGDERDRAATYAEVAQSYGEEAAKHHATASDAREKRQELLGEAEARQTPTEDEATGKKSHPKPKNPLQEATGAGNAGVAFPSLLAHLPLPATVQIYVSADQLLNTWGAAILNLALQMLNSYVGFLFDGILSPGKSAGATWLLALAKSTASGVINAAQTYLMEDQLSFKIATKLGPVNIKAKIASDPKTGKWKWSASAADATKRGQAPLQGAFGASVGGDGLSVDKASAGVNEVKIPLWNRDTPPPVSYGSNVPVVNGPAR